ncbi:antitoxin protein of toxin-antitoxin system [Actinomycetospora succinea]|uniref:Antitoxin protein of toxin-antitoxin system n=1 Tax=Actinomycetospora succinea TaxID=663603 RepID=A0A4R6VED8_9PSEU|nr:antitoxin [Actinomycetospora succinea]TDQ60869.1 antitoxin protein of toxin-antitoxin system [Actinomycetospora succinea]
MSRDDYVQQGKQFANDLRDTASKKVADNEDSILGAIGKAARWVDQKTGGKYSEQIGKAEAKAGEGVGWAAKQGTGDPQAPGAAAGDGTPNTPGTTGPTGATPTTPPTTPPTAGATPTAPGASATPEPPTGPVGPPASPPVSTPPSDAPTDPGRPTHPPRDDSADWPRPPQS